MQLLMMLFTEETNEISYLIDYAARQLSGADIC